MNNSIFPLHTQLNQMISAYWISRAIYVISKLNIADLIKNNSSLYCEKLAQLTNTNSEALYI